jgi:hypothetical protein
MKRALLAAVAGLLAFAGTAQAGQEQVTSGAVTATLSWSGDAQDTMGATLGIARNGASAYSQPIPDVVCDGCRLTGNGADDVQVEDLDGDGEPEVIVTGYTGGAECCLLFGVWDFTAPTYRQTAVNLGTVGYSLEDLDGDGIPEFNSTDARFNRFYTDVADELQPPQVMHYLHQDGQPVFADVTSKFTSLIRKNASQAKKRFAHLRRRDANARGWVATYVADQYLLGRGSTGTRELDAQVRRGIVTKASRASILRLLHSWHYR